MRDAVQPSMKICRPIPTHIYIFIILFSFQDLQKRLLVDFEIERLERDIYRMKFWDQIRRITDALVRDAGSAWHEMILAIKSETFGCIK
ncbi:MAG: hypothetical protein Q8Q33_05785 [Chlamydiota bacterium]|nr:hypothetical protein [Chlamydiota bacterium]